MTTEQFNDLVQMGRESYGEDPYRSSGFRPNEYSAEDLAARVGLDDTDGVLDAVRQGWNAAYAEQVATDCAD